ncbi:hypothetical protein DZK34_00665 [Chlamydia abortus]|nr:hypothetical protein CEF07_00665 [Chlamydia abortus]QEM73508.1 hypothetical protein DZK34_00665 [Chlamydia abortus]
MARCKLQPFLGYLKLIKHTLFLCCTYPQSQHTKYILGLRHLFCSQETTGKMLLQRYFVVH